ncbi:MAG TPA: NAD(P)-dependent oxidoreductase [Phnomibacter sp.]|nr:NAD(P)-dependent oxidoreductase [Phnomibacter sp.]
MADHKVPTTEAEFDENFAQKKPLMNDTEAFVESSRCLFCYDAPCMNACPTYIDIPLFIKQIHTGNILGAAKTIYEANWLGNACGKVCPTSELCEGACVFNHQHIRPIDIGRLQNFATDKAIRYGADLFSPGQEHGGKVAVIGAGPAGIACAAELRSLGYTVDVYEAKDKPTGLALHGTAPYKITNEEVLDEINFLQRQMGFRVLLNAGVHTAAQLEDLERRYDAIFLGVGIGPTADLYIDGEEKQGVVGAVEFIETLRMKKHEVKVPARVIVLGGGNTAMDAASESARMGAEEVTIAYRRSRSEMGAYEFEYKFARGSGVVGLFNAAPVAILGDGVVTGVKFVRTGMSNGKLTLLEGTEFVVDCDMVIKATGQAKQGDLFRLIDGLKIDEGGRMIVSDIFQTTNPRYFAGGDAVNGGAEVVNAAYEGKMAARGIHRFLNAAGS